jgi:Ca2+:H+ antiporter
MLAGGASKRRLAWDTMYATVMIIANGVGACVLLGALRHREQTYRIEGPDRLAALATLVTLVLVMPAHREREGAALHAGQLIFVAVSVLVMWCVLFFQTVRHRDYFLPPGALPPTNPARRAAHLRQAWASFASCWWRWSRWSGSRRRFRRRSRRRWAPRGAPMSAWRSPSGAHARGPRGHPLRARRPPPDEHEPRPGSALASIGLTIPVVVAVCLALDIPLTSAWKPRTSRCSC